MNVRHVHLVVDDDNPAAIALYRSLGFEATGRCYLAYLSRGTVIAGHARTWSKRPPNAGSGITG